MIQLNELQKTKLIPQAIEQYIKDKNSSKAELSRISGVGTTQLNYICKGEAIVPNKSGGSVIRDKYYIDLCNVIGFKLERVIWKHFNTDNFKTIINQIRTIREEKSRGTIDADTGAGKSYSCEMYQKRYPKNTFVVKCYADENKREFTVNIAEMVGVEIHGSYGSIIKRVCAKLLSLDDALLIIDEAEYIKNKPGYIDIIKAMADRLENKVPFILCGMEINGILQKAFEKHKQGFRQVARRFSNRIKCEEDIREDIIKISADLGLDGTCSNWLATRIKNFEELKIIVTVAINENEKSGEEITVQLLTSLYHK